MEMLKEYLGKLKWVHVFVAIAGTGGFTYYTLDQAEIDNRNAQIEGTRGEIEGLKKRIQEMEEFERQYEERKKKFTILVEQLQKMQKALPSQFNMPDLIGEFLKEAKQLEIEVVSIKSDPNEASEELYNTLGFNLDLRGTFVQFFIFLDRIATMERLVNVGEFKMEKNGEAFVTLGGAEGAFGASKLSGGRTAYPQVSATFRLLTYRYRQGGGR